MKTALLLIGLISACMARQTPSLLAKLQSDYPTEESWEDVMGEFKFFSESMYTTYNGFVRGLYREHDRVIVPQECLGEWVTKNLTYLERVWEKVWNFEILSIPYDDAIEAAKDLVNLFYRNRDYCMIDKLVADIESICDYEDCFDDIDVIDNIKTNFFAIAAKVEPVVEYFLSPDLMDSESDEDILKMADTFGEAYGAVISYILGFNKRFQ